MPRVLLHICCGPCTVYPLRTLRDRNWSVHGFFYNPNIQPYQEFRRRLDTLKSYARMESLQVIVRPDYDLEAFFRQVAFREHQRCRLCYSTRIEATARLAKKSRFDAFTTTLLYSRHQKHELACSLAEEASRRYGIPFYYEDFRAGWKEGQEKAKTLGLYRQQYCGCIYSEKERFYTAPDDKHTRESRGPRLSAGQSVESPSEDGIACQTPHNKGDMSEQELPLLIGNTR